MDVTLLEEYAAVMAAQPHMTELEVKTEGFYIRLKRNLVMDTDGVSGELQEVVLDSHEVAPSNVIVTALNVGFFIPTEPALNSGDRVDAKRPLGAINTVGIINAVHTAGTGRVVAILVEPGQPVEYGQSLFEISIEP